MLRRANSERWRQYLVDRHVSPVVAAMWASFARSNVHLIPKSALVDDTSPIGATKLGGLPDLPAGAAWPIRPAYSYPQSMHDRIDGPTWTPKPLSFLAQINLADVASQGCDLPLPDAGLLLFFYDAETQPWGFDPHDSVGTQVLFVPDGTNIERSLSVPLDPSPVRLLECLASEGLPSRDCFLDRTEGQPGCSAEAFDSAVEKLSDDDWEAISYGDYVLGGWPHPVQNPMELECELATNGINAGGPEGYADPRVAKLRQSAADWRLLLQLDSDDDLNWMWGDVGRLYVWCRETDLSARRFERCWTVLQCY
jgi:uncharacterized protein YwqG